MLIIAASPIATTNLHDCKIAACMIALSVKLPLFLSSLCPISHCIAITPAAPDSCKAGQRMGSQDKDQVGFDIDNTVVIVLPFLIAISCLQKLRPRQGGKQESARSK